MKCGDIVTQGTPILAVGSTGYSTGPHAHFEVRIKGEYVEPLDYITSYNIKSMEEAVKELEAEGYMATEDAEGVPEETKEEQEGTEETAEGTNETEEGNE